MNAQEKWKQKYKVFMCGIRSGFIDNIARRRMDRYRREAALERHIARLQRELAAAHIENTRLHEAAMKFSNQHRYTPEDDYDPSVDLQDWYNFDVAFGQVGMVHEGIK